MSERQRVYTYLIISNGSQPEKVVVWDTLMIRVGRHVDQDLVFENPEVSREHALLRREGDKFVIEDLKTANGTFVNGERIRSVALAPNDRIQIGDWTLLFCQSRDNPAVTLPHVTHASHLKDFHPLADDASGRTMLGLVDEDDSFWNPGSKPGRTPPTAPVRNLDAEIGGVDDFEKDDLAPIEPPPTAPGSAPILEEEPDPLMASAFDLGEPLPPVGRGGPGPGQYAAGEQSAPTYANPSLEAGAAPNRSIEITLQIDGVDPGLLRTLQSLLGQRFDLRALSMLLKAITIR